MPGLPRVALDEAEAAAVARQPGVGPAAAVVHVEVELGGVAVAAAPRRRHPPRVGVAREEHRLLGVAAEAAHHDQVDALGVGRGVHEVERRRDGRAHRLAVAVDQRARVAAAGRPAGAPAARDRGGRHDQPGPRHRPRARAARDRGADGHLDRGRRPRAAGQGERLDPRPGAGRRRVGGRARAGRARSRATRARRGRPRPSGARSSRAAEIAARSAAGLRPRRRELDPPEREERDAPRAAAPAPARGPAAAPGRAAARAGLTAPARRRGRGSAAAATPGSSSGTRSVAETTSVRPAAPAARRPSARTRCLGAQARPPAPPTSCQATRPTSDQDRDRRQQLDGRLAPRAAAAGHGPHPRLRRRRRRARRQEGTRGTAPRTRTRAPPSVA